MLAKQFCIPETHVLFIFYCGYLQSSLIAVALVCKMSVKNAREWRREQISFTFLYANMLESTQCRGG